MLRYVACLLLTHCNGIKCTITIGVVRGGGRTCTPKGEKKFVGVIYRGKLKANPRQSKKSLFKEILLGGKSWG